MAYVTYRRVKVRRTVLRNGRFHTEAMRVDPKSYESSDFRAAETKSVLASPWRLIKKQAGGKDDENLSLYMNLMGVRLQSLCIRHLATANYRNPTTRKCVFGFSQHTHTVEGG